MLITIFNKYFERVDVLRNYTFAQYNDKFLEIGTFTVNAVLCEENLRFLDKSETYFLHFENGVMGKVDNAKKESDGEFDRTIILSGRLMPYIMDKRVINGLHNFNGNSATVILNLAKEMFSDNDWDSDRWIHFNYDTKVPSSAVSQVNAQQTGGTMFNFIQPLLQQDSMGIDILPRIEQKHETSASGILTNISQWDFVLFQGKDRTANNTDGNKPVIFSQSFNNIERSGYEVDSTDYCNIAYVAGEGEGSERVWREVEKSGLPEPVIGFEYSGFLRQELFVDARDLQKETEDKTYTDTEYNALLDQRGQDNLLESDVKQSYDATLIVSDSRYTYGRESEDNYYKGDIVTVWDNELGLDISAIVTGVTRSVQGVQEFTDIEVGYRSMTVNQKLKRKGVI